MQILKYKHEHLPIIVRDGVPQLGEPIEKTYYFAINHKSMQLFEQEYGKPLLKAFEEIDKDKLNYAKMYKALACSTYLKVEGSQVVTNELTMEEFKETALYGVVDIATDFCEALSQLIYDFLPKSKPGQKGTKSKK